MKIKNIIFVSFLALIFAISQNAYSVSRLYDRQAGDIIDADKDDAEFDNGYTALNNHEADTSAHDATGGVVGAAKVQTLSNKTFNGDVGFINAGDIFIYSGTTSGTEKLRLDGLAGDITTEGVINIGTGGVVLSDDGDGALTITGAGNGSDEDLRCNFDDTANTIVCDSTTGVTSIQQNGIGTTVYDATGTSLYERFVETAGTHTPGDIVGAPVNRGAYNIRIIKATTSATNDSIQFTCKGGDCSETNPGYAVLNATSTAGSLATLRMTSPVTINLTGAHWGAGGTGDLTGRILRALLVNDNGTLKYCVALLGGRQTLLTTDTSATATDINLPEEVLCNSAISSSTNTVYEMGWFRSDFDDTGGSSEDLNTIQTGVNDVVTGKTADGLWQPWNPTEDSGWSGSPTFTPSSVRWTQVGREIIISPFKVAGTSDSSGSSVVLPAIARLTDDIHGHILYQDNTTFSDYPGVFQLNSGATTITYGVIITSGGFSGWTNSGTKTIYTPQFSYEVGPAASFID